jgi:hypothetical protein
LGYAKAEEIGVVGVVTDSDWRWTFRPDIPSPARIYDYLLGGKDNYAADREAAKEIVSHLPNSPAAFRWNRTFLRRAVRYLVNEQDIVQLLDIGTGLPTVGNVHEVANEANPNVKTVYVDNDPVVLAHGRDMLQGMPLTVILEHDLRDPELILSDPGLRKLISFDQPVGLLLVSMLHFISDADDPADLIRQLLDPFPSGSYVALSHGTADETAQVADAAKVYDKTTTQAWVRSRADVLALVEGMELVDPGIVWTPLWRPEPGDEIPEHPNEFYYYALVARKPLQ